MTNFLLCTIAVSLWLAPNHYLNLWIAYHEGGLNTLEAYQKASGGYGTTALLVILSGLIFWAGFGVIFWAWSFFSDAVAAGGGWPGLLAVIVAAFSEGN